MNELVETDIYCPYCGEKISVIIEMSEAEQHYIEDCQVCCRPIEFYISIDVNGQPAVSAKSENDV